MKFENLIIGTTNANMCELQHEVLDMLMSGTSLLVFAVAEQ